jgi:hypothetical protein
MMHKIFRPQSGQRHARYTAALTTNTAVYRGDALFWDITTDVAPTDVTDADGGTPGAKDFVFVTTSTSAATLLGKQAGICCGKGIQDRDTTAAIASATDTAGYCVVQTWGVFEDHANTVDDTVVAGAHLVAGTVAAELADATTFAATDIFYGLSISTDAAYTRGTATDNTGVSMWVRCDL